MATIGLLGKKLGMTQIFDENGVRIPVTVLKAGPCTILEKRTTEKNGYAAYVMGFEEGNAKRIAKAQLAQYKKNNIKPKHCVKEIRVDDVSHLNVGDTVTLDIFEAGDKVDVQGITKGKGFAGGMKRWGWKGGPGSHGSQFHRGGGSIQSGPRLSRITKGKHMPGHMGSDTQTIQNLIVAGIEKDENLLLVKGSVPGANNEFVTIRIALKTNPNNTERIEKFLENNKPEEPQESEKTGKNADLPNETKDNVEKNADTEKKEDPKAQTNPDEAKANEDSSKQPTDEGAK